MKLKNGKQPTRMHYPKRIKTREASVCDASRVVIIPVDLYRRLAGYISRLLWRVFYGSSPECVVEKNARHCERSEAIHYSYS